VELEEYRAGAVLMRLPCREVAHDQAFAAFDVDADLLAGLHAVEKHRCGKDRGVAIQYALADVVRPHPLIHEMGSAVLIRHGPREPWLERCALGSEIGGGHLRTRPSVEGLRPVQDLALQRRRKAAGWLPERAAKELHNGLRKGDIPCG